MTRLGCFFAGSLLLLTACGGDAPTDDGGVDAAGPGDACVGAADGTACGTGMICVGEACAASQCGDGYVDTASGEVCDDGNDVAFDGFEPGTCAFPCEDDTACDNGRVCDGAETGADHVCAARTPPGDHPAGLPAAGGDGGWRGADSASAGCGTASRPPGRPVGAARARGCPRPTRWSTGSIRAASGGRCPGPCPPPASATVTGFRSSMPAATPDISCWPRGITAWGRPGIFVCSATNN